MARYKKQAVIAAGGGEMKGFGWIFPDRWMVALVLSGLLILGAGCATTETAQGPSRGSAEKAELEEGPVPVYHDFKDVLIPAELSLVRKRSFVYSTPSFTAGVLAFKGDVDGESLVKFFTENMGKDGWLLRSSFRYRRIILNFEKDERSCLINIAESALNTEIEIWVAPQATAAMP